MKRAIFALITIVLLILAPLSASASVTHSWMIGSSPLSSLKNIDPVTANTVFNRSGSFVIGPPPSGYATTRVTDYKSYADFQSTPSPTHWVLYDPEKWSYTPLAEQKNPGLYMKKFATLAHQRGNQVIMTPARDLMLVSGAVCVSQPGEKLDQAYIRCQIPAKAASAPGDVVEVQAQGDQPDTAEYSWLVGQAKAQVTTGVPVWAGLTTDRGDPVSAMVACYNAVQGSVQGFWLNTTNATISTADQFLQSVSP